MKIHFLENEENEITDVDDVKEELDKDDNDNNENDNYNDDDGNYNDNEDVEMWQKNISSIDTYKFVIGCFEKIRKRFFHFFQHLDNQMVRVQIKTFKICLQESWNFLGKILPLLQSSYLEFHELLERPEIRW